MRVYILEIDLVRFLCLFMLLYFGRVAGVNAVTIQITTENWPPNNYLGPDDQVVGYATEKVRQIFDSAGIDYTIKVYPWARAYRLARNEKNTAIYSIFRSKEREPMFQWVCPLIKSQRLYFFRLKKRTDIELKTLEDAKRYHITTARDEFDHQFLLENGFVEQQHFVLSSDDINNIKKLLQGRADLVISTPRTIKEQLKSLGQSEHLVEKLIPLTTEQTNPLCLAFSLSTPNSIVTRVRQALAQQQQADIDDK